MKLNSPSGPGLLINVSQIFGHLSGPYFTECRSFMVRITAAGIKVIRFAIAIGRSFCMMPYTNHMNTPVVKTQYISREIPVVSFVLMVL